MGVLTAFLIGIGLGSIRVNTRKKTWREMQQDLDLMLAPMSMMYVPDQYLIQERREEIERLKKEERS